ncbi:MAG: hypothetical protein GEU93_06695 [Propionibacteriales bacterium]|nr:hypothetical protein [Propionibacteriales bacterium]
MLPPGRRIEEEPLHLAVGPDVTPPRIRGCRAYQTELPLDDLVEAHGVVRTGDLRTAFDLGRYGPRPQAVAAVDAFLHTERADLAELWRRARLLSGVRNCRLLRANLAVVDAGVDSPAESVQRVLFIDAGLVRPKTQIGVFDRTGALIGYLDMGWPGYQVGSEFDGEEYHGLREQIEHDEYRRRRMRTEADWIVDSASRLDLWGRPAALVARTAGLLVGRGWRPPPQVMDQIVRAAEHESRTGRRWVWMPLDRLLAA